MCENAKSILPGAPCRKSWSGFSHYKKKKKKKKIWQMCGHSQDVHKSGIKRTGSTLRAGSSSVLRLETGSTLRAGAS